MRKSIKAIAVTGAAVLGISTVGIGWAYFTETTNAQASGGGTANMSALAVDTPAYVYDSTDNKLWPGHAADVHIPLKNNNAVPVQIMSVAADSVTSDCSGISQDASSIALWNGSTQVTDGIIPNGATYTLVITDGVKMGTGATTACENLGFSTKWNIVAENR